ncbi:MAG: hypothetical protein R3F02_12625 [Thiolinea sp.]
MKYFFPILMALVIAVGLGASLTPYIAEQFFPTGQSRFQKANPEDAKEALAAWFGVASTELKEVNAIRYQSAQHNRRWYHFVTDRQAVEQFIKRVGLEQLDLNDAILKEAFLAEQPPVTWWQPESLQRESYFSGSEGATRIKLIYNAEQQTGYLLIETKP